MPFLFGMKNNVTIMLCVAAMLIESYIAINYVNDKNYRYNDTRRTILAVLSVLTILFTMTQYGVFTSGNNTEKLLLVFIFVGSIINATYMLGPESNFGSDWRRKFIEIFYYITIGLAVATVIGVKEAQVVTRRTSTRN